MLTINIDPLYAFILGIGCGISGLLIGLVLPEIFRHYKRKIEQFFDQWPG